MEIKKVFPLIFWLAGGLCLLCWRTDYSNGLAAHEKTPQSCVDAKCHASMADVKYLHGPFAVKECNACHVPIKDQKHKFEEIKKA
ncbi:MAG: hypothetical protein M1391_06195, partial [Bacteroidetes bacterium]|nr:hypothetical protein [Bacteroidota bacterium]